MTSSRLIIVFFTFFLVHVSMATTPFKPAIKTQLLTAVNNWCNDSSETEATNGPIGEWDTSDVTDMSDLFQSNTQCNPPIGKWDTSKVTDMKNMFYNSATFDQPIGEWDTSKVTDMTNMFRSASAFNQPLGNIRLQMLQIFKDNVESKYNTLGETISGREKFREACGDFLYDFVDSYNSNTCSLCNDLAQNTPTIDETTTADALENVKCSELEKAYVANGECCRGGGDPSPAPAEYV